MKTSFFLAVAILSIGAPALAAVVSTPELDGGTLTAIVSGITGLAVSFRMLRANKK